MRRFISRFSGWLLYFGLFLPGLACGQAGQPADLKEQTGLAGDCTEAALGFMEPDVDTAVLRDAWNQFEAYLCTLGLRHSDGRPKQGWIIFVAEMGEFLSER